MSIIFSLQAVSLPETQNTEALTVQGDQMEYQPDRHFSQVTGHAVAEKGSGIDKQELKAHTFDVHFAQSTSDSQKIERIVAITEVTFKKADLTIQAHQCTYQLEDNKEIITCVGAKNGDVVLTKGPNKLTGSTCTVDLKTGIYRIAQKNKSERVKAEITPSAIKRKKA